jgi:hypothetical protein
MTALLQSRQSTELTAKSKLLLPGVLLFVALYLYFHLFALTTPILRDGDQWFFAQAGARMVAGQIPYRDFFEMQTPGTELVYAGSFRLFGERFVVANLLFLLLALVFVYLVTSIARTVLDDELTLLSVAITVFIGLRFTMDAAHHWFSAAAAFAALACVLRTRSLARIMMAGAFCGLSSLFTQTRGLAVVLALAAFFWWETYDRNAPGHVFRKRLLVLLAAYAVVLGAGLSYFLWAAGPYTVFNATVLFPLKYYGSYNPASRFWEPLAGWPQNLGQLPGFIGALFLHALPLAYFVFPFDIKGDTTSSSEVKAKVILIAAVGSALFLEVINSASLIRLVITAPLAIILALWMLDKHRLLPKRVAVAGLVALVGLSVVDTAMTQRSVLAVLDLPTGRAAFLKQGEDWYEDCAYLAGHTKPGDWYFGDDDFGFPLKLRNPAFLAYVTDTNLTRPEHVQELIQSLERYQVPYISIENSNRKMGVVGQDHLQPLREYIETHYEPAYHDFMRRRDTLGPTNK